MRLKLVPWVSPTGSFCQLLPASVLTSRVPLPPAVQMAPLGSQAMSR